MPDLERHLTWENFDAHLLQPGRPAMQRIQGDPSVFLFVDHAGSRIGLRVAAAAAEVPGPTMLAEVAVNKTVEDGQHFVELSTSTRDIYREFYYFLISVSDLVQVQGKQPSEAVAEAMRAWQHLLKRPVLLTLEEQLGLLGELWFLVRLGRTMGPAAFDAWVGPAGEPHDFRTGDAEFEVKVTRQPQRIHVIHGLRQMQPGVGHQLYLLSLHLQPAGTNAGFSLNDQVAGCRTLLAADLRRTGKFRETQDRKRYREDHADVYAERYSMRGPPTLIDVAHEDCPRFTPSDVLTTLGPERLARVVDVFYTINVEGLGHPDGSTRFLDLLPA